MTGVQTCALPIYLEDEASSESDKKVKWYSDCHDNLTDDVRMVENKASAE